MCGILLGELYVLISCLTYTTIEKKKKKEKLIKAGVC